MADLITFTLATDAAAIHRWTMRGIGVIELLELSPELVTVNGRYTVVATTEQIVDAVLADAPYIEIAPNTEQLAAAVSELKRLSVDAQQRLALRAPSEFEQLIRGMEREQ